MAKSTTAKFALFDCAITLCIKQSRLKSKTIAAYFTYTINYDPRVLIDVLCCFQHRPGSEAAYGR